VPSILSIDPYIPTNTVYRKNIPKEQIKNKSFAAASYTLKPSTPVLPLMIASINLLLVKALATWFQTSINIRMKLPRNPDRSPFSLKPAGDPSSHSILSTRPVMCNEEPNIFATLYTARVLRSTNKRKMIPKVVSITICVT